MLHCTLRITARMVNRRNGSHVLDSLGGPTMNYPIFDPATEKYVSLATYRRSGIEVKTPVWIAEVAGRYYVFSAGDAGKVKRISRPPRVTTRACDVRWRGRGPWIEAHAIAVSDPALIVEARRPLRRKSMFLMRLRLVVATLTYRIRRRGF